MQAVIKQTKHLGMEVWVAEIRIAGRVYAATTMLSEAAARTWAIKQLREVTNG